MEKSHEVGRSVCILCTKNFLTIFIREIIVSRTLHKNLLYTESMHETVGNRIRELRVERHLTQKQLGEKLSVSQDTISLWELDKRKPYARHIIKICRLFDVSADYLLGLIDY